MSGRWYGRGNIGGAGRKPNSVTGLSTGGDHLSGPIGYPSAQAPYPRLRRTGPVRAPQWQAGARRLCGLAGGGVCPAAAVTSGAVRSYRTISPLPDPARKRAIGGVFSVTLSLGSPRVAVSDHRALPSSDFPPARPPEGRQTSGRQTHSANGILAFFLRAVHAVGSSVESRLPGTT